MPRRGALLNGAAVLVPVRPTPDMSVLHMRLSAGWRATPGFTIRRFRLFILPISGRAGPAGARRRQHPAFLGHGHPAPRAAGDAPTIRLATRPNLSRLGRAHDVGSFDFPLPRRRNCARPGLSGHMWGGSGFAPRRRGFAFRAAPHWAWCRDALGVSTTNVHRRRDGVQLVRTSSVRRPDCATWPPVAPAGRASPGAGHTMASHAAAAALRSARIMPATVERR
jgi:hypothetical protein